MDPLLGLPGLAISRVDETFEQIICFANVVADPPTCPCGADIPLAGHGTAEVRIADTPMRGKPTALVVSMRRFICSACKQTSSEAMPPIADRMIPRMTIRLARFVENRTIRVPAARVAIEVGVSDGTVRTLSTALAERLHEAHKFPTPEVLGIDDLRIKKRLYTVITDGRTGRAIALVDSGKELDIRREMARREIDPAMVKVVVSDMGGSNIAVFKNLFAGTTAIHVADKWHTLKGAKEALSLVINKRIDQLRRRRAWCEKIYRKRLNMPPAKDHPAFRLHPLTKMQARIDTLRDAKKHLLGARILMSETLQLLLDINTMVIKPVCTSHPTVGKAFWVSMRLHAVYAQASRAAADHQIDRFFARAASKSIAPQMKIIVERVRTNRNMILNYYDAIAALGVGHKGAPTTGPTEQRNSTIKSAWRASRGLPNHKVFSMKALYEPWELDTDIAVCGVDGCDSVEGPFPPSAMRRQRPVPPLHIHRCPSHP